MARKKRRGVSHTARGVASVAAVARDLLSDFTRRRGFREGEVGMLLFGFFAARYKPERMQREFDVDTVRKTGGRGRPEQIDFVIGRKRHNTGLFSPDTVIELAVRRTGDLGGLDPVRNLSEIAKLVRADAQHRILLLLDLTEHAVAKDILGKYENRGYEPGRPTGDPRDRVSVVYVGEGGTQIVRLRRQNLRKKRKRRAA
jgi:hypothetical protein